MRRLLKPKIDANEFNLIFDRVEANSFKTVEVIDFVATHVDTLLGKKSRISESKYGFDIIWDFGMVGSEPNPLPERYQLISNFDCIEQNLYTTENK